MSNEKTIGSSNIIRRLKRLASFLGHSKVISCSCVCKNPLGTRLERTRADTVGYTNSGLTIGSVVCGENCIDACNSQDKTGELVLYNNTSKSLYQTGHTFSTYQVIKVLVLLSLFLLTERTSSLPAGTYIIKVTEWQNSKIMLQQVSFQEPSPLIYLTTHALLRVQVGCNLGKKLSVAHPSLLL